jgi:hypothetical protein
MQFGHFQQRFPRNSDHSRLAAGKRAVLINDNRPLIASSLVDRSLALPVKVHGNICGTKLQYLRV